MFFNKLKFILVFAVLLVAGLAFVATPATAAVTPVLSVPDELANDPNDSNTAGIQVYGIRAESVNFELTITFIDDNNTSQNETDDINTPVTGFDISDIVLNAADSSGRIVPNGATASPLQSNADGSVYTTTITVKGNINTVHIAFVAANTVGFPQTPGTLDLTTGQLEPGPAINLPTPTPSEYPLIVNILRSAAPPLTLSPNKFIGGNAPFTVTLTSTQAITLTRADLKVTGGSIDSLTPDAARRVWTVTIRPGVGIAQITVEPSTTGSYIFPKGTFTVDTTGPVATITGTPPSRRRCVSDNDYF